MAAVDAINEMIGSEAKFPMSGCAAMNTTSNTPSAPNDPDVDLLHAVRARLAAQGHSTTHTYQVIVREVDTERRRPALTVMTLTLRPSSAPAASVLPSRPESTPAAIAAKLSATQRAILQALLEHGPCKGDTLAQHCGFRGWSSLQGRNGQRGIKGLLDGGLVTNGEDGYELTEPGRDLAETL